MDSINCFAKKASIKKSEKISKSFLKLKKGTRLFMETVLKYKYHANQFMK